MKKDVSIEELYRERGDLPTRPMFGHHGGLMISASLSRRDPDTLQAGPALMFITTPEGL